MTAGYSYENHMRTHNGITLTIINRSPVFAWDEKDSLKTEKKHQLYEIFSKYISKNIE